MGAFGEAFGNIQQGANVNQFEPETTAFKNRIITAGETISNAELLILNDTFSNLKNNHLGVNFLSRFDCLWISSPRIGRVTSKFNWIKNAHNAIEVDAVSFTDGFASNGTTSYLKTDYIASRDAVKYQLHDCAFGVRVKGTLSTAAVYTGHGCQYMGFYQMGSNSNHRNEINGVGGFNVGLIQSKNLMTLSYNDTVGGKQFCRERTSALTGSVTALPTTEFTLLKNQTYFTPPTEIFESGFIGSSITQEENDLLSSIIDNYLRGSVRIRSNAVVMTLDDGYATDYTIAYPFFAAKNLKFSTNITTDFVETAAHLTWSQVKEMQDAGIDCGFHSMNHVLLTTYATVAEVEAQFVGVNAAFAANNCAIPTHGSYPQGAAAAREWNAATKYGYLSMRGAGSEYASKASNKKYLPCYDIGGIGIGNIATQLAMIDGCMSQVDANKIFYAHQMQVGDTTGSILGLDVLTRLINYCQNIGISVLSQKELYEQKLL